VFIYVFFLHVRLFYATKIFLRATAAIAVARLSHRNSVRLSVCLSACPYVRHTGGSVKSGAS